jgi:hypothetical protein
VQRHCAPPPYADPACEAFYDRLADFVRLHAGQEAIRIASLEDDRYAMRLRNGEPRAKLVEEGRLFFDKLLGPDVSRPDLFAEDTWKVLQMIRNQWA